MPPLPCSPDIHDFTIKLHIDILNNVGKFCHIFTGQGNVNMPAGSNLSTLTVTVISVMVAIIVFFTIGFLCGCLCQKYKQSILTLCKTPDPTLSDQSSTDSKVKEQGSHADLEMTDNVAYGPLGGSQLATS